MTKIKIRKFSPEKSFYTNELVKWEGKVYKWKGYEYGTYPVVEDLKTGETITLPHY